MKYGQRPSIPVYVDRAAWLYLLALDRMAQEEAFFRTCSLKATVDRLFPIYFTRIDFQETKELLFLSVQSKVSRSHNFKETFFCASARGRDGGA